MSASVNSDVLHVLASDVLDFYANHGSKLRGTVRRDSGVEETMTTFGPPPFAALPDGEDVECPLDAHAVGDRVDRMDELKANIDERMAVAKSLAYALGRKTDELIVDALARAHVPAGVGSPDALTERRIEIALRHLDDNGTPDDGERYALLPWRQWSHLLASVPGFANADFLAPGDLPWPGTQAKLWHGVTWIPHAVLDGSADRPSFCHIYHASAVGHAFGSHVTVNATPSSDDTHFVTCTLNQGACLAAPGAAATVPVAE